MRWAALLSTGALFKEGGAGAATLKLKSKGDVEPACFAGITAPPRCLPLTSFAVGDSDPL